jgi:uncharacterized membrane protein
MRLGQAAPTTLAGRGFTITQRKESAALASTAAEQLEQLNKAVRDAEARLEEAKREVVALRSARDTLAAALNGTPHPRAERAPRKQTVAKQHLDAVREYVRSKGRVRQADIGNELGLNSGIVSVAIQRLEGERAVEPRGKDHGSRVWEFIASGGSG